MSATPTTLTTDELRASLADVLERTRKGEHFVVTGPHGRETLIVDAKAVRRLQDAYLDLVGERETERILKDPAAAAALAKAGAE